jgi:hypothetical protein
MKWKVVVASSITVMGILASYLGSHETYMSPQQSTGSTSVTAPTQEAQTGWVVLTPGVKVMRMWTTSAKKWPQIAVLELSTTEYENFKKSPSDFVNTKHVFPKNVQPGATFTELETPPAGYTGLWSASCVHTVASRMSAVTAMSHDDE